jgi:hypothetical protein
VSLAVLSKTRDSRAPASGFGWGIAPSLDERGTRKNAPHHITLDARALPVNDSYGAKARSSCFEKILLDHELNFTRSNRVEIENVSNL